MFIVARPQISENEISPIRSKFTIEPLEPERGRLGSMPIDNHPEVSRLEERLPRRVCNAAAAARVPGERA